MHNMSGKTARSGHPAFVVHGTAQVDRFIQPTSERDSESRLTLQSTRASSVSAARSRWPVVYDFRYYFLIYLAALSALLFSMAAASARESYPKRSAPEYKAIGSILRRPMERPDEIIGHQQKYAVSQLVFNGHLLLDPR